MLLQSIGRYEIIGDLGRGAMGLVYKAKDPTIGRTVAIKTMRIDVHGADDEDMLRRFRNEAQAVGLLNHPNIVTIYDAGEQDNIFYIAMEFIEGTTLHQMMSQRRVLGTEDVIRLSRQICSGLDYAHSHNIVHRDIKPANIMITSNGTVKIMDFGIAKTGGTVTSTGQVLGTPNYMSPEQVKGKPLDGRSDLFSFGVLLYEMLTGEKPFTGQNVTTIIYKIVNESPIPPRDLDVTIHPGLSMVVTKALSKAPDERYQSGADLVRDLENYKTLGPKLGIASTPISTASAAPAAAGQGDKTTVLPLKVVTGSTARVPAAVAAPALAPIKAPVPLPLPKPELLARTHKRNMVIAVMAAVLVLGSFIGGFVYSRSKAKMRQLEADLQKQQEQQKQLQQQPTQQQPTQQQPPPQQQQPATGPAAQKNAVVAVIKPESVKKKASTSPNRYFAHQGELRFVSQPDGAKVEVDGWSEPTWVTPFQASNLAEGQHTVVFSKPGFAREARTVNVTAGKSDLLTVTLNAAVATIRVDSTPQNASILVDGQDTGKTTPAEITVEKGQHRVQVRKRGYKDEVTALAVVEGQKYNFAPTLSFQQGGFWRHLLGSDSIPEGKGVLYVHTKPEGATILVDGHTAPKKTDVRWVLDPGTYDIALDKEGFKTVHRTATIEKGKVSNVDEILEKKP
jgi:serine/threonine protein kinase